jgi:hypothetical protein
MKKKLPPFSKVASAEADHLQAGLPNFAELCTDAFYMLFLEGYAYDIADSYNYFSINSISEDWNHFQIALTAGRFGFHPETGEPTVLKDKWTSENHELVREFLEDLKKVNARLGLGIECLEAGDMFVIQSENPEELLRLLRGYVKEYGVTTLDNLETAPLVPKKKTIAAHIAKLRERGHPPFNEAPGEEISDFALKILPARAYFNQDHVLTAIAAVKTKIDVPFSLNMLQIVLEQERGIYYQKPGGTRGEFCFH